MRSTWPDGPGRRSWRSIPRVLATSLARPGPLRPLVKLQSTAGTGYTYVTRKNRRNDPDRLVLVKYDPVVRRRVEFKETR